MHERSKFYTLAAKISGATIDHVITESTLQRGVLERDSFKCNAAVNRQCIHANSCVSQNSVKPQ